MSDNSFPARRQSRNRPLWLWPAYAGTIAVFVALIFSGAISSGYEWNWKKIPSYIFDVADMRPGPLLAGLGITLQITAASFALTLLLGLGTALARLFGSPVPRTLARVYLELVRNSPLMVQIFIIYFVLGPVLGLDRFWAAVIALSLFEASYLSEIIRSGLLAIPREQWQVAWTLGLSTPQTMRHVILPQAAPMLLPPVVSLCISLVKDSALVSTIAIFDLTMQAQILVSQTFSSLEIWLTVALMYGLIALFFSWIGACLEKRMAVRW